MANNWLCVQEIMIVLYDKWAKQKTCCLITQSSILVTWPGFLKLILVYETKSLQKNIYIFSWIV